MDHISNRRRCFAIAMALLAVIWTAVIFMQSAKSGSESSADTGRVMAWLRAFFETLGVEISVSSLVLRKLAHFGEYMILGLLGAGAILTWKRARWAAMPWGYAVAVALCDEFIVQRMTEGRGPRFTDVLIDSAGAAVGVLLVSAICWGLQMQFARRQRREER